MPGVDDVEAAVRQHERAPRRGVTLSDGLKLAQRHEFSQNIEFHAFDIGGLTDR